MLKKITLLLISLVIFILQTSFAQTRIMPLGNSITYGVGGTYNGYRGYLYDQLSTNGYVPGTDFVFVGSQGSSPYQHEGHSGKKADEIRDNIISWLTTNPADIILLHIGTNDISTSQSAAAIATEIEQILNNIDTYETSNSVSITVILAQIINSSDVLSNSTRSQTTTQLNNLLDGIVTTRTGNGDLLELVNMETGIGIDYHIDNTSPYTNGDMDDNLHPNNSGYTKMAEGWFDELNLLLLDSPAISNLTLNPNPTALTTENLICDYDLDGTATTSSTAWYKDGSPIMTLYLPMEGGLTNAVKDYSGNNNPSVTLTDSPTWTSNAGYNGNGAYVFDGDDVLNAGNIFPTSSSYTVSAWVKKTTDDAWQNIVSNADNSFDHLLLVHNGNLECGFKSLFTLGGGPITNNTWYFVAVTFDYASGKLILYKNGSEEDNTIISDKDMTNAGTMIGRYGGGASWRGTIDDVRIYATALTPEQISAMYNSGTGNSNVMVQQETTDGEVWNTQVVPYSSTEVGSEVISNTTTIGVASGPTISNLILTPNPTALTTENLICDYDLDGTATTSSTAWYKDGSPAMTLYLPMEGGSTNANKDYSGNNYTVTVNGNVTWNGTGGHDGKGAYIFDGDGDDLNAGENFPTNSSYTKTAWVYRTGSGANGGNNIISGDENSGGHAFWAPNSYSNKLSAGHNQTWNSVQDAEALALNTWYFVAVTYDEVTDMMRLYKNGAEVDNATVTIDVTDATISVGSFGVSNGYMWLGTIDDARVYPYVLTPEQILAMYNGGTGNNNIMVQQETTDGEVWNTQVVPFSSTEVGSEVISNTTTIGVASGPTISNLTLTPNPNAFTNEDLICSYNLSGTATTSSTAWYKDGSPAMTLYLPMEGGLTNAVKDYSGNNYNATPIASPTWNSTGGYDGNGTFTFNGTSQYLDAGQHFPTGSSYTKTAWVRRTGTTGNNIISGGENSGGHALWANRNGGKRLEAGHNGNWDIVYDDADLTSGQWYFIALTFDYATGEMILYRDGTPKSTGTVPGEDRDVTISNIYIGSFGTHGYRWTGNIDDARVYPYILTPEQISAMYNSGTGNSNVMVQQETTDGEVWNTRVVPFSSTEAGTEVISNTTTIGAPSGPTITNLTLTPNPNAFTNEDLICSYNLSGTATTSSTAWYKDGSPAMTLYLPMEGGSTNANKDYSGNNYTVTATALWNSTAGKDGNGAYVFDGTNDLRAGDHLPLNSSYTKMAWVYKTGNDQNDGNIISGDQDANGHAFWARYGNNDNKLSAGHNQNWQTVIDDEALALNTWYQVAVTFNYSSGEMILYKNGAEVDRATLPSGDLNITDPTISVGSFGDIGYQWIGTIDDARVYPYVLTPEQILAMYNGGTGNNNIMVQQETTIGDTWECYITPFSSSETGVTTNSNSVTIEDPLPVELISFEAKIEGSKIKLFWRTETEVNNYGFEIERKSIDGLWGKVGFVNGNGNSNSPKTYSFNDINPSGGSKFLYRLKQIDNDGQFEYSDEIEIMLVPIEYKLYQNYPNPFNPTTKIKFALPEAGKVSLKIYDITGSEIAEIINSDYEAGYYDTELNLSNFSSGVYIFRLQSKGFSDVKKLMLIK